MYNILSLDGGGSWAIIKVMTLLKLAKPYKTIQEAQQVN